jgi:hypothetical protein
VDNNDGCGWTTDRSYIGSYSTQTGGTGSATHYPNTCLAPRYGFTWQSRYTNWPAPPSLGTYTVSFSNGQNGSSGSADQPVVMDCHCDVWETLYPGAGQTDEYDRSANTVMRLHTNGKALSSRSRMFSLFALVYHIFDKRYRYPDDLTGYNGMLIPYNEVTMDGKQLGSDYRAYAIYADNSTHDITPTANCDYYEYGDCVWGGTAVSRHDLRVYANSVLLSPDILTASSVQFCVGQRVTLQGTWYPPLPSGTSQYDWLIDTECVNKIVPANGETAPLYQVDPTLKRSASTSLWWYDHGGTKSARCLTTNTFTNGQIITYDSLGWLSVYAPTLSGVSCPGPRSFMWLTSYFPDNLSYGDLSSGVNGMEWSVPLNSAYDGRWAVTQKYKATYTQYPYWVKRDSSTSEAVDAAEFYHGNSFLYRVDFPQTHLVSLDDYPRCPSGMTGVTINIISAEDYVRFKPGTADGDGNIYVTLGVIRWNAFGEYYRLQGLVSNLTPAATGPDSSYQFPWWTRIIQDQ